MGVVGGAGSLCGPVLPLHLMRLSAWFEAVSSGMIIRRHGEINLSSPPANLQALPRGSRNVRKGGLSLRGLAALSLHDGFCGSGEHPLSFFSLVFSKIPRKTSKTPRISLTLRTLKNPGK